jgi:hypothetical protein
VLPFRLLRPDPETGSWRSGLPDALTGSLGTLRSLVVRSSVAAARFAGEAVDLKRIAEEADVDLVVSGTLLRAGGEVRVTTAAHGGRHRHAAVVACDAGARGRRVRHPGRADRAHRQLAAGVADAREEHQLKRDVPASAKAYETSCAATS